MILVVGATGQLGGLITQDLLESGRSVRAMVRREVDGRRLAAAGGQAAFGDLKDAPSIRAACRDIDAVITTANAVGRTGEDTIESVDQLGTINLVQAAAAAGVRRFVYISALGADPDHPMPLLRAKGLVEQQLTMSGMGWTVLQPNAYMDTWIPLIVGGPALRGDPITLVGDGRRRHSMVAMRDVAAYTTAVLDHPQTVARIFPVGGPEPVTWLDVVAVFEAELHQDLPIRTIAPGQAIPGVPRFVSDLAAALAGYDSPLDTTELSTTLGVKPTSLADYVRQFLTANATATLTMTGMAGEGARP